MTSHFDLKYRPKAFSHVLGNSGVVSILLMRSKSGSLASRSMMFGGPKGCLSYDTYIQYTVMNDGRVLNHKGGSIETLYERFHSIVRGKNSGHRINGSEYLISSVDGAGCVVRNRVIDVLFSGEKECFRLKTAAGCFIDITDDHEVLTPSGYTALSLLEIGQLVCIHTNHHFTNGNSGTRTNNRSHFYVKNHPVCGSKTVGKYEYKRLLRSRAIAEAELNGLQLDAYIDRLNSDDISGLQFLDRQTHVHHHDECVRNDFSSNLEIMNGSSHNRQHAQQNMSQLRYRVVSDPIVSIESVGVRRTYDIKMASPYHNFIASNIAVHNCGKTSLARIVAKAIACSNVTDGEPCCECSSCIAIDEGTLTSVDEFDAATQGTVDRIRSIVQDLDYGTVDGRPRVVVLDEAHRLSKASQDALLKPMEDRRMVVVLCTTEPHAIKSAIRDRVEEYPVSPAPMNALLGRLQYVCRNEHIQADDRSLEFIIELNNFNPRTCLTFLESVSLLGSVTVDSIKSVARFSSMEEIVQALSILDSNPAMALTVLDHVFSYESATWVRDNIVAAISSAVRESVGAKSTYPVPTSFFQTRGRAWATMASALSRIDRPDFAAIEATLLETVQSLTVIPISPSPILPPPPISASVPTPAPVPSFTAPPPSPSSVSPTNASIPEKAPAPSKSPPETSKTQSLELDGVKFTRNESLTSLDERIQNSNPPPPPDDRPVIPAGVQLDKSHPMSAKEFGHAFAQAYRQGPRKD